VVLGLFFSERSVYQIKVKDQTVDGSFTDFELVYDLRVARQKVGVVGEVKPWWQAQLGYLVVGGIVVIILALIVVSRKYHEKNLN